MAATLRSDPANAYVGLPFGIPGPRGLIGVKDNIDVRGFPTGNGLGRKGPTAAANAEVVERLRAAGFGIMGKQRMDEAAFGATGDNPHHGRLDNPAAPGHSPGGSSCGGAVAVVRGQAAALGTDTLGSVRIPAAYCGILGFKPSRPVLPMAGIAPLSSSLDHAGLLARDVGVLRDLVAVFLPPGPPLAAPRVLVPEGVEAAVPGVRAAFDAALARMRGLGWTVEHGRIAGWAPEPHRRAALLLIESEGAAVHRTLVEGRSPAMSPAVRAALRYGRDAGAGRLDAAVQVLRQVAAGLGAAFGQHDLVATPTVPAPAFAWEDGPPADQATFTALANWAGLPAISLPLPVAGRPVGLQLIGAAGQDWAVLHAAASLCASAAPHSRA